MSRSVLITRHPDDCGELQRLVAGCGLAIHPYPVLRVEDVDDVEGWTTATDPTSHPDWVVVASPRAPQRWVDGCRSRDTEGLLELPVAVIGEGTVMALPVGIAVKVGSVQFDQ